MHSFIISSSDNNKALKEASKINNTNKIDSFDIEIVEFEKALSIEDIRNIQKNIFLKPFRGDKKSIILILKNGASISAQNSMLKLLEEPPKSSIIIIITDNFNMLLPTIISRCKIINLDINSNENSSPNKEIASNILKSLDIKNTGEALKIAQDLSKDKKQAIDWLEKAILVLRNHMLDNLKDQKIIQKNKKIIVELEQTRKDLKNTNVNLRLALENLFLNI